MFINFDADLPDLGKSGCRGIAIYVVERLHPLQVSYQSGLNEHLWINISLDSNENLLVGSIYRSPSSDKSASTNDLCDLLNQVCSTMPSYLLVIGDFNYPNIDWINGCLTKTDHNEQLFDSMTLFKTVYYINLLPSPRELDQVLILIFWI